MATPDVVQDGISALETPVVLRGRLTADSVPLVSVGVCVAKSTWATYITSAIAIAIVATTTMPTLSEVLDHLIAGPEFYFASLAPEIFF